MPGSQRDAHARETVDSAESAIRGESIRKWKLDYANPRALARSRDFVLTLGSAVTSARDKLERFLHACARLVRVYYAIIDEHAPKELGIEWAVFL